MKLWFSGYSTFGPVTEQQIHLSTQIRNYFNKDIKPYFWFSLVSANFKLIHSDDD